jgi:hypothetical protein
MKTPIPVVEAVTRLWDLAKSNPIPGLSPHDVRQMETGGLPSQVLSSGFGLSWERGWGVDARLTVRTDVHGGAVCLRVDVGWSSSTYSPHAARTAADLHARVADLACWMQTVIDSLPPLLPSKR